MTALAIITIVLLGIFDLLFFLVASMDDDAGYLLGCLPLTLAIVTISLYLAQ